CGALETLSSPSQMISASGIPNRFPAMSARADESLLKDSAYFFSPPNPLTITRWVWAFAMMGAPSPQRHTNNEIVVILSAAKDLLFVAARRHSRSFVAALLRMTRAPFTRAPALFGTTTRSEEHTS